MKENKLTRRKFVNKMLAGSAMLLTYPWLNAFSGNSTDRSRKIKVGIIGVGSRGTVLLYFLNQLAEEINVEVAAVCDNYEPHYKHAVKMTGGKAKAYYDYRKLIEQKDLDAVVIATPLHEHAHMTIEAMQAGKHVFCEKSMARHLNDVKKMADVFYDTGLVLQIGHQRMFDPRYIEAVKLIQDGEIGKITQIRAYWHRNNDWRRPVPEGHPELEKKINWRLYQAFSGGLMTELASHQIQVANWFKNDVPVQVMGKGSINYWKDGREVYDNVALVYSYADGTQFVYDSLTSNRHYGLEEQIMGDKGTLEMEVNKKYPEEKYLPKPPGIVQLINDIQRDVFSQSIAILGSSWVPELKIQKEGVAIADKQDDFSETKMELEAFVDTVREGKPVEGVFEQGYWATVWALLGLQAMDEQTIVTLPDYLKL